jgi:lysophospholipase L1-like esterase
VRGKQIDVITVFAGTNDFGAGVSLEKFQETAAAYVSYLKYEFPEAKIVLITPLYRDCFGEYEGDLMIRGMVNTQGISLTDYKEVLCRVAEEQQVMLLDVSGEDMLSAESLQALTMDGLHPNKAGNRRLAKRIESVLP